MTSKERKCRIKPGAVFMLGGRLYHIVNLEGGNVTVKDVKTGKIINHGLDNLAMYNLTFRDE